MVDVPSTQEKSDALKIAAQAVPSCEFLKDWEPLSRKDSQGKNIAEKWWTDFDQLKDKEIKECEYITQPGDCLSIIAKRVLQGDGKDINDEAIKAEMDDIVKRNANFFPKCSSDAEPCKDFLGVGWKLKLKDACSEAPQKQEKPKNKCQPACYSQSSTASNPGTREQNLDSSKKITDNSHREVTKPNDKLTIYAGNVYKEPGLDLHNLPSWAVFKAIPGTMHSGKQDYVVGDESYYNAVVILNYRGMLPGHGYVNPLPQGGYYAQQPPRPLQQAYYPLPPGYPSQQRYQSPLGPIAPPMYPQQAVYNFQPPMNAWQQPYPQQQWYTAPQGYPTTYPY